MPTLRKSIITGALLLALLAAAAGILYLNNVYLPVKIKSALVLGLQKALGCNVEVEKLTFSPVKGVVARNIVFRAKNPTQQEPLLLVRQAYFNILYLPLLRERKIIIPVLHVDSPRLFIKYAKDGSLNISCLALTGSEKQQGFSVFIQRVNVFAGECLFEDQTKEPFFTRKFQDISLGVTLGLPAEISFRGQTKTQTSALAFRGKYALFSKEGQCTLSLAGIALDDFKPYLKTLPFLVESGTLESAEIEAVLREGTITVKGILQARSLEAKYQGLSFKGNLKAIPELTYRPDSKELHYKTVFKISESSLSGISASLEKLEDISGEILLTENSIQTQNLKLGALGSRFSVSGTLEEFSSPYLKLTVSSDALDLGKTASLLPQLATLAVDGSAKVTATLEGNIHQKQLPMIKTIFDITEAKCSVPSLKNPLEKIRGRVSVTLQGAEWRDLTFEYLGTNYVSNGKLADFSEPTIQCGLDSKDLKASVDLKVKGHIVKVNPSRVSYAGSDAELQGWLDLSKKENPVLRLSIKSNLDIPSLLPFFPQEAAEIIKKNKITGNVSAEGDIFGDAADYRNLEVDCNVHSDAISAQNLKFTGVRFRLFQKDGLLQLPRLVAEAYSGAVNLVFTCNLKSEAPAFVLKANVNGVELAKLTQDLQMQDKNIAGTLNLTAELNGRFKDPGSLKGTASFSIQNGRLWQLNLFKGLGELILLPEYEKIVFKEASADFDIGDGYVSTDNLDLTSDQLKLHCQGRTSLADGKLDYTAYVEANKELIRESADLRKFSAAVVSELGSAFSVRVSGTIQKPKYSLIPVPLDIIKRLKDFLLGK